MFVEFLYIFSLMFLSIFGLVMLLRCAAQELFRDNKRHKNKMTDVNRNRKL